MALAKTKEASSAFLLEVYGNHMLERADIDLDGLKRVGAVAAHLDGASVVRLIDVLNECAASAEMKSDHYIDHYEPTLSQPPLPESSKQWSRSLLTAYLDRTTDGTGLYKPLVVKSVTWMQGWFDDCCDTERRTNYFSAEEGLSVAAELGELSGRLRLDVHAIAALLTSFASSEADFRQYVADSFGSPNGPYMLDRYHASDLDEHYTCHFLEAWARTVGFPATYSAADCVTVAAALRQWPTSFRKEAALLAIGWIGTEHGPEGLHPGVLPILDSLRQQGSPS
jgi:hypothetical protein